MNCKHLHRFCIGWRFAAEMLSSGQGRGGGPKWFPGEGGGKF